MNIRLSQLVALVLLVSVLCTSTALTEDLKPVKLPAPKMSGGRPLMDVLKDRQTTRQFSAEKLSEQVLSNLLWAAWGINRPESGKRTAPSASNNQEIDIYAATAEGLYLYDAKDHALKPVLARDIRANTGTQAWAKDVPVNLVYVADYSRMPYPSEEIKRFYSAADTGYISQNVYLFCASEGLATVVRGLVDREGLAKVMKLRPDQKVVLVQSVGYPLGGEKK